MPLALASPGESHDKSKPSARLTTGRCDATDDSVASFKGVRLPDTISDDLGERKIHTSLRKLVTKSFGLMLLSESHTPSLFILFSITFTVPKAENASWGNTGVLCWSPHANINNLVLNYFSAGNTSSPASPQSLDK